MKIHAFHFLSIVVIDTYNLHSHPLKFHELKFAHASRGVSMNTENLFDVICWTDVCVQLENIEDELIRSHRPLRINRD